MHLQEIDRDTKRIAQSNVFTEARFQYSRGQMDLLFAIMAQLGFTDKPNQSYSISISDIENITRRKWNHKQLQDSISEMGDRHWHIEKPNGGWKKIWLFQDAEYVAGESRVEITLTNIVRDHLFGLKENFTVFQLSSALDLKSSYSKRIYTLCCRWKDTRELSNKGFKIMLLEDFRYMIGIKKDAEKSTKKGAPDIEAIDMYPQISELKTRVLNKAKKEINKLTDVHFDYELIKRSSARYNYIKLFITPQDRKQLEIDFNDKKGMEIQRRIGLMVNSYGFSEKDAQKLTSDHNWKAFNEAVEVTNEALRKGKVKDPEHPELFMIGILKKTATNF